VDPDLDEAARTMGADTLRVFWSIALPLSVRAILAGVALSWMRSFGEFGATVIVAYHPFSFPVFLYEQFGSVGYTPILPMALIALVLGAIALLVSAALERIGLVRAVVGSCSTGRRSGNDDRITSAD
jgi:ABC-type sulfate transport system permease component